MIEMPKPRKIRSWPLRVSIPLILYIHQFSHTVIGLQHKAETRQKRKEKIIFNHTFVCCFVVKWNKRVALLWMMALLYPGHTGASLNLMGRLTHISAVATSLLEINKPFMCAFLWVAACHLDRKYVGCSSSWLTREMASRPNWVTWRPTSSSSHY